jgi:hypothetical protein
MGSITSYIFFRVDVLAAREGGKAYMEIKQLIIPIALLAGY